MKETTYKEYDWHNKDVQKALEKLGIEGKIVSLWASYDHGLYLHVKTVTETKDG
jgi:hypothetical protein